VRITDEVLLLQARHVIEARARIRGEARTVDQTPASAELIIDIAAPQVSLAREGLAYVATASDLISPNDALRYRFQVAGGAWSAWQSSPRYAPELLLEGGDIHVEVVDEGGNVGAATARLIRGLPNPDGSSGCSCRVPAGNRPAPLAALGAFLVLGTLWF